MLPRSQSPPSRLAEFLFEGGFEAKILVQGWGGMGGGMGKFKVQNLKFKVQWQEVRSHNGIFLRAFALNSVSRSCWGQAVPAPGAVGTACHPAKKFPSRSHMPTLPRPGTGALRLCRISCSLPSMPPWSGGD